MDITYLKEIDGKMADFFKSNGFSGEGLNEGCFGNGEKQYTVSYNEERKEFSVSVSTVVADEVTEGKLLSSWYFNEADHGARDTECIAEDFTAAVAADLGVKLVSAEDGTVKEVVMPKAAASGDPGIEAFTQKFLALFPQYKETYRSEVAKYGEFLYVDFFKKYGIEKMLYLVETEETNKKQLQKYFTMLGDMHYNGEQIVADLVCSVIIAGSFGKTPEKFKELSEKYLAEYPFLKTAGYASALDYRHNRKLRSVIEN